MATPVPIDPNGHLCTDENLNIALGCYSNLKHINKFGHNETVGTSFEDVWEQEGVWTPMAAASTLAVSSSSANDTSAGTGARTIQLMGLDADYNEIEEIVTLNGQTPVVTTALFLRINRAYIVTAGSGEENAGDLYIADDSTAHTAGVPITASAIQAKIGVGEGQTLIARYTIPAGFTAYVSDVYMSSGNAKIVDIRLLRWDHANLVKRIFYEGRSVDVQLTHEFKPYMKILEKETILAKAKVTATTGIISIGFDLILHTNL